MKYANIKSVDVADGLGVRVSLFVSGCRNHCKGCFNEMTWDFNYGSDFTEETVNQILTMLAPSYIDGFTLLGGEPFEEENQPVLTELLKRIKKEYPQKNIWCFTGYILDKDLLPLNGKKRTDYTDEMLSYIDVLIDGPFILEKKDLMLKFRGSSNQRVIDLKRTIKERKTVLLFE